MSAPLPTRLVSCLRRTCRNLAVGITQVTVRAQDILPRSSGDAGRSVLISRDLSTCVGIWWKELTTTLTARVTATG